MVKPGKRFAEGTSHFTRKGKLHIIRHYETSEGVLMTVYTMNDSNIEEENRYNNVTGNIYRWARENNLTEARTFEEFANLELVRPLKFGLELELISPISKDDLLYELIEAGINVETPNRIHDQVGGWKLVRDGSIRTTPKNPYGFELVSPPSTDFNDLKIICEILEKEKIKINNSCGMHVHHEIKTLKRQQIIRIYEFYNKYEEVIDASLPKSRKYNDYCKPISDIIDRVRRSSTKSLLLRNLAGGQDEGYYAGIRYFKLNLRSFLYYGTIEFRQHHGSTSYEEISNWILFTHKIIDRAIQINDNVEQFEEPKTILEAFNEMIKELKIEGTKLENSLLKKLKKQARKSGLALS